MRVGLADSLFIAKRGGIAISNIINNSKYKAFLAAFCAVGWSFAYPLIKVGYGEFQIASSDLGGKVLFAGIRFLCAGLIIIVLCRFKHKKINIKVNNDYLWLFLLGLVNTALHYMFAYIGLGYNSGARSTILDSSGSFMLIILSTILFSDDKLSVKKAIGCVLGFFGIIISVYQPNTAFFDNITFKGDGMILINAVFAALGGIITRVVSKKINMLPATGYSMLIGGIIMLAFGLIIKPESRWNISFNGIIVLIILILISAVCFAVYNELLSNYPISEISIFNALIPVLGVVFSSILLNEELKWQYICSVIIVAIGIYLVNMKNKKVGV